MATGSVNDVSRGKPEGNTPLARRPLLCLGVSIALSGYCGVAPVQGSEADLRVAFVYNFLKFIEWPAFEGASFTLCALGAENATRQALSELDNKLYQQRYIHLTYLDSLDDVTRELGACQLVYVPVSGAHLALPKPLPEGILLVVDEADPRDIRVGISLRRTEDDRIDFVVNELAIRHANVKLSSQLLKLAKQRHQQEGS